MHKQKIIAIIFCFGILFGILFTNQRVSAQWIVADPANTIAGTGTWVGTLVGIVNKVGEYVMSSANKIILVASKMAALLAVQRITQAIIGTNSGAISDYNNYLFVAPQQRAMAQMNSFFNTVSKGRASRVNYEGVSGMNYDAYLISQAKLAIAGQPFTTNLQAIATDPTQMFGAGNMKGIMTYMQCANNVACYTMTAQSQYATELDKATQIAKAEQNNGFLPVKKGGKIIQPSAIVASALTQIDQLGTQVIMNADLGGDPKTGLIPAETQIVAGAGINIAARSFNYMLADTAGKNAIRNKNDEFPFSMSYNLNTGLGLGSNGVNANTGLGAVDPASIQIGNTCATATAGISTNYANPGVYTSVTGQKATCKNSKWSLY